MWQTALPVGGEDVAVAVTTAVAVLAKTTSRLAVALEDRAPVPSGSARVAGLEAVEPTRVIPETGSPTRQETQTPSVTLRGGLVPATGLAVAVGVAAPIATAGAPVVARATVARLGAASGATPAISAGPRAIGVLATAACALPLETMRPRQRLVVRPEDASVVEIGAARTASRFVNKRGPGVAAGTIDGPRHSVPLCATGKTARVARLAQSVRAPVAHLLPTPPEGPSQSPQTAGTDDALQIVRLRGLEVVAPHTGRVIPPTCGQRRPRAEAQLHTRALKGEPMRA